MTEEVQTLAEVDSAPAPEVTATPDRADVSAEDAKVQTIASAVHTPEVIAAYEAAQEAVRPAQPE